MAGIRQRSSRTTLGSRAASWNCACPWPCPACDAHVPWRGGRYSNERNALVHVRHEKEVCLHYVALEDLAGAMLRMKWKELKKLLNKVPARPGGHECVCVSGM